LRFKKYLPIIALFLFAIIFNSVSAAGGSLKTSSGSISNIYFTGDASDPAQWYQDAMGSNSDIGIEICGHGSTYVGATYALNASGAWKYALISYRSSTSALSQTDQTSTFNSSCSFTSPGYLTLSPSYLTTPSPDVYYAAFPGRLWIGYAGSANPGVINNFEPIGSNGYLRGSYYISRSFNQVTRNTEVQTPTIYFQTSSGSFSKSASDTTFGVNSQRRMVIGDCEETTGRYCSSGYLIPTDTTFPLNLSTGLTAGQVNDQTTHTRYIVLNGISHMYCIGANLNTQITNLNPDPVYYNQTHTITYSISNPRDTPDENLGGNVDVTTVFNVNITIYEQGNPSNIVYSTMDQISTGVDVDETIVRNVSWVASALSGMYTVQVIVDSGDDIVECNEGDNIDTQDFELKPVYIPNIYINGNPTNTFPNAGTPYNFSIILSNSDGENATNATLRIYEVNGMNLFAPVQIWNKTSSTDSNSSLSKTGIKTINSLETELDLYGISNFTIIPTGNKLFSPQYNYTHISDYLDDYYLYLEAYYDADDKFKFIGTYTTQYFLNVSDPYTYEETDTSNYFNEDIFVRQTMDWIYTIFSNFWKTAVSG